MKTVKIFSLVILISALNYACSDSFFDLYPSDELTEGNFYTSGNDYETVLNDGYRLLREPYLRHHAIGDIASDDAYNSKYNNNGEYISINESNVSSDNAFLSEIWKGSYGVISRANIVLDKIDNETSIADELKNRYKGEANFLRSLMYFNLIRIFGDVPLVITEVKSPQEAFDYKRETIDKVYEQIINDLSNAEKWLPEIYTASKDIGRATSLAAKSLLGHIYLTRKEYDKAAAKFSEVIDSKQHELMQNYEDIFDAAKSNNKEVIFAVQYARGLDPVQGNQLVGYAWPNEAVGNHPLIRVGQGYFLMTADLVNVFEDGDKRKVMNNTEFETDVAKYVFTKKFWDNYMTSTLDSGCDYIVYRYADILLMYAETQNELNNTSEALKYLKLVRTRAGLATDDALSTSQDNMRLALEKERRVELNCEGHRWFDLVRTGHVIEVMNNHFTHGEDAIASSLQKDWEIEKNNSIEPHELIFPIPFFEVNLNPNNLKQNPGY